VSELARLAELERKIKIVAIKTAIATSAESRRGLGRAEMAQREVGRERAPAEREERLLKAPRDTELKASLGAN
jgi:hypothetical protein